jgi:hypothetical protein
MYNPHSTPSPSDPLNVEVFVKAFVDEDPPSRYLDPDMAKRLTTAAESFCGAMPTPQLVKLFALVGAHICKKVSSVEKAYGVLANCICWFAIRHDARTNEAPK